jgi:uncharacterized protein (DUF58 family)
MGSTQITKYVGFVIIAIVAMLVFRLLMPQGSMGSFGIWVAAIFFGVIIAGILRLNATKKK